jgi:hypothetical protein
MFFDNYTALLPEESGGPLIVCVISTGSSSALWFAHQGLREKTERGNTHREKHPLRTSSCNLLESEVTTIEHYDVRGWLAVKW